MLKVRVYEVARDVGLSNRDILSKLASLGVQVRNHMSSLDVGEADRIKRAIEKEKQQDLVEERIRPTVVRRRAVKRPEGEVEAASEAETAGAAAGGPAADAQADSTPPVEREPPRPARPAKSATRYTTGEMLPPAPDGDMAAVAAAAPAPAARPGTPPPAAARADDGAGDTGQGQVESEPPQTDSTPPDAMRRGGPGGPRSYAERLGNSDLPPGVVARGGQVVNRGAQLSAEDRSRIVSEHAARQAGTGAAVPPRRRELVRSAIGPTGRQQAQQRGRPGRAKKLAPGKKSAKTEITTPSAAKRLIRIEGQVGLQVLAARMSLKATDVLMRLMQMGMTGVMINSTLDLDTAQLLAQEFGFEVENVAVSDEAMIADARGNVDDQESVRALRSPIVTVMGHVDHGKTSLLDKVRRTDVAAGEAGGITQHLGAYRVETPKGTVVFLDTPGHAAFTQMRARGADATDVVVLVVAADDGVMPQTKEAISHAKQAKVPIIVAVNKCDKEDARPDAVRRDLAAEGLQPEEWGGETMFFNVSARTGEGLEALLDGILLQSEVLELKANSTIPAEGVVLEAYLDKGRGPVANLLVRNGSMSAGDIIVCGATYGKVRAMTDEHGKAVQVAGPATPVEVLGLSAVPDAGDPFSAVTDVKVAQQLSDRRKRASGPAQAGKSMDQILAQMKEGDIEELKLIIKTDMQGSTEAIVQALKELSTEKVKVNVILAAAGGITENDVMLASASKAIIIGFHVRATGGATKLSKSEHVEIRTYSIIYEAVDDVKKAMEGLLKPVYVEKPVGHAEVRALFQVPKGVIAGCYVTDGKIARSGKARVMRDSVSVWQGTIKSLRRVKDDVKEVISGMECGVGLEDFNDLQERDIIECFEIEEVSATL